MRREGDIRKESSDYYAFYDSGVWVVEISLMISCIMYMSIVLRVSSAGSSGTEESAQLYL